MVSASSEKVLSALIMTFRYPVEMSWGNKQTITIEKNKFQTNQNATLHNRTEPVTHANVTCFPGLRNMLASDVRSWINSALLPGSCACIKLCVRIGYIQIAVFCLKFIFFNNSTMLQVYAFFYPLKESGKMQDFSPLLL